MSNPEITLKRFCYSHVGTFGQLSVNGFECYTVERPWLDNKPNESCIPCGDYDLELGMYNRGGYPAYEILDVPDRTHIKIHIANTMDDVVGCIGLGQGLSAIAGRWSVGPSRIAFRRFMKAMSQDQKGKIRIVNSFGGYLED